MITSLKPGCLKVMELFYNHKDAWLHLREIARRTHLHGPSATRFLNSLEEDGILKSEREANLKRFSVTKSSKTFLFFEIFDLDRYDSLLGIRKTAISTYLHSLPKVPIFAILFGPTAKGTHLKDSEIDILLITNSRFSTVKTEKKVYALTKMKIRTLQLTYNDFLTDEKTKDDRAVLSAIGSGYPLMNNIEYYRVLYTHKL